MHFVESDDILMPLKSVGESPMNPLGTKSSLTVKGRETGPPSFVAGGVVPPELAPPLLPGSTLAGGVDPGAEQATEAAAIPAAAIQRNVSRRIECERVRVMADFVLQELGRAPVTPTECRRCRR